MSDALIKLVQAAYGDFGRGDIAAVLARLTPDVSWGLVGRPEDVPMAGIRSGKDGVAEFFKCLAETHALTRFEPQKFVATDDMVFVWGRAAWTMHRSGVSGANDWLHVFSFRGDKVCSYRGHQDTALLAEAYHAQPAAKRANG